MATDQEKGFLHPQRAATVREDKDQFWKIDRHIIAKDRLGINIARAREDGRARMNHDGQSHCLRALIHRRKGTKAVSIGVGRNGLMTGMELEGPNPEFCDAIHFPADIRDGFRMNGAESEQAARRDRTVLRDPVVDFGREAHDVRADVVDQAGPLDA